MGQLTPATTRTGEGHSTFEPTGSATISGPVELTKDRIIAAATKCFVQYGTEKTTIDDIATSANLSRPTIYRYFRSKNEIAQEIGYRGVSSINLAVRKNVRSIDDPLGKIIEAMATSIEFVTKDDYLRELLLGESGATMRALKENVPGIDFLTHERLEPLLVAAIEAKVLQHDLDIDETIDWMLLVQIGLIMRGAAVRAGPEKLRAYLTKYVIKGMEVRDFEPARADS